MSQFDQSQLVSKLCPSWNESTCQPASSGGLRLLDTPAAAAWWLLPASPLLARPLSLLGTYQPRFDWRVHANSSGLFLHGEREWRRAARVGTVGGAGGLCLLTRRGEKGRRRW